MSDYLLENTIFYMQNIDINIYSLWREDFFLENVMNESVNFLSLAVVLFNLKKH